jgi:expansin (peptidoglycan-binding protein)
MCGTTCSNPQTDANNCGMCGNACAPGGTCTAGKCNNPVVMCTADNTVFSGHITTYSLVHQANGVSVACHYPDSALPQQYGAMNEFDYLSAAACGACVEVTNTQNNSKITIPIVDECPLRGNEQWCFQGSHHIDLSGAAYSALGASNNPAITWRYVPCTSADPIKYFFDPASKDVYLAVTIMNTRYRVAKVEVMNNGSFVAMTRSASDMWQIGASQPFGGAGAGPFTFRVTDIYNHVLQDTNIALRAGQSVAGAAQFASCP